MADFDFKEVCKICFNASSQKANPTLTPEEKAINGDGGRKICPKCKQNWSTQRVMKDTEINRWVTIRPRPLKMSIMSEYQLCTSVLKRQACPKGAVQCTFAHSRAELVSWNRERYKEPRPIPNGLVQSQLTLCKNIVEEGICGYGQKCIYAHSEEERFKWMEELQGRSHGGGYMYPCTVCGVQCTSQRQYEEHLSGQRHKQMIAANATPFVPSSAPPYYPPMHMPPRLSHHFPIPVPNIRPMPDRIPISGFRLCIGISTARGCFYGHKCTFAHSKAELDAWNEQVSRYRGQRIAAGSIQSHLPSRPPQGDLDEFDTDTLSPTAAATGGPHHMSGREESVDFAQRVRTTVMLDYQEKESGKDLSGFEKSLLSVTISEISGREESLTLSDSSGPVSWLYEISSTAPRTLQSVILFDMLAPDFAIDSVDLVLYGGHTQSITPQSKAANGSGLFLAQRITPPDKVNVKILFKPRSGVLGQMIVFDFGNFYMARYLCVHVINEQDKRLLASTTHRRPNIKPEKPDYFWEMTYSNTDSMLDIDENGDETLPEHALPRVIEELVEKGKYDNMQRRVLQKTYVRRMHNLLFLEEFQERKDLSRYDLYNIEMKPKDHYHTVGEIINDPRYSFVTIEMDELLFEGARSIRRGDRVMMVFNPPSSQPELHHCMIHSVMREAVVLKMSKRTAEICNISGNIASVRFLPSRIGLRTMHEALDRVDPCIIFPDGSNNDNDTIIHPPINIKQIIESSRLNEEQKTALSSILDPMYTRIPTLVMGPFGCGKTMTLCECANILSINDPSSKILICTHNNSAADIYVKAIHEEYTRKLNKRAPLLRLYYSERNPRTVEPDVRGYCKMRNDKFCHVESSELTPYSIIVTTTITARMLWLNGVEKGYFTHILVDEAAQVLEAELLVALCLADKNTKIVLAGDDMQMAPPVFSPYAKKYGLDVSLLERLHSDEFYCDSPVGSKCRIQLSVNHRSHYDILHLPSKLFYDNKLVCKAVFPDNGPKHIPNLQFVGVDGHEAQDDESPSYYNDQEIVEIAEEVNRFCTGSYQLPQNQVCVLAYYQLQVTRIRNYLRNRKLSQVDVHRIEGIQGKEYRALIISTVRTCASIQDNEDSSEHENGFLNNVKFFNTAITRAKEWLVIVGEPITLCTVGYNTACWIELVENCIKRKTFRYHQCADMFMKFLETRVISRQIMQKNHGEFLKKSTGPSHASKIIAPPISSDSISSSTITRTTPTSSVQSTVNQQQQVIKDTIMKALQTPDENVANIVYGGVLKLNPSQLNVFLTQSDNAMKYVRDLENIIKRSGTQSQGMSNGIPRQPQSQQPISSTTTPSQPQQPQSSQKTSTMNDLPQFLQSQVESLTQHAKYFDAQKCNNQAAVISLAEQKNLLMQQMNLVNQQIMKYREFIKLNSTSIPQTTPLLPSNPPLLMNSLTQPMNQLNLGGMAPTPRGVANINQPLLYEGASQPIMGGRGGLLPRPQQQPFIRQDGGGFQQSVPLLPHPHLPQRSMTHPSTGYGVAMVTPPGSIGGNTGYMGGLLSQPPMGSAHQPTNQFQISYQDPFVQSQPSYRQTTQLISPLNNMVNKTWNSDDNIS